MKHLGDITKLHGSIVPPVNVIIGGSPCQDLSVAGKREGLSGERSGLFMEQIRVIREMREADERTGRTGQSIRPRFMVWENVPGTFSSNKGADFGAVLQETIRIVCQEAPAIPMPDKGWPTAGCLVDVDGRWSVAWRVLDAQFWGVPQRRRRIALVADFGGTTAPEILFERKSVSGHFAQSKTPGQGTSVYVESSTAYAVRIRGGCDGGGKGPLVQIEKSGTLGCGNNQTIFCIKGNAVDRDTAQNGGYVRENVSYTLDTVDRHAVCAGFMALQGGKAGTIGYEMEKAPTLSAMRHDASVICLNDQGGSVMDTSNDVSGTLRAQEHGHQPIILDMPHACDVIRDCGEIDPSLQARMGTGGNQVPLVAYGIGNGQVRQLGISEKAGALNCMHDQQAVFCPNIAHTLKAKGNCDFREDSETYIYAAVDCRSGTENGSINGTLQAHYKGGYNLNNVVRESRTVRRLTPLECERLQGFPDGWTDIGEWTDTKGKVHDESSDSARYKALGNSIALPPWFYVLRKLSLCCGEDWTMASLFDGIGGFPLIWETINGKGSCLWASEIEEFPMAVTKIRFSAEVYK